MKTHPYKASCVCKRMRQNRGTGRLKKFRIAANREVRCRMRASLRKYHLSNGQEGDYNDFLVAAGYWD